MASIRRIKKDIDYLTNEVFSDCYLFMYLFPEKQHDAAVAIIQDAVTLHNNLKSRTRKVEGNTKAHFRTLFEDLLKGVDGLFRRISELTK
jgi:deoxyadenosine/deoxycytidine kinase